MKKLLFLVPVLLLVAAGCSSKPNTNSTNDTTNAQTLQPVQTDTAASASSNQTQSSSGIDSALNELDQSIAAEQSLETQTDTDIITTDTAAIINASSKLSAE